MLEGTKVIAMVVLFVLAGQTVVGGVGNGYSNLSSFDVCSDCVD